ncbi:DUF2889 domain-containing protein [Azospirillum sp. RWY-5-1]|uniref:DUF2889 domain-containing protein n=1 Tax=Azospirillum oleiclasticum TaxID=2735135 RepID=A0ABX2TDB6_9PROT|nr:DUF2889 domain-containing protein [Azospirillum oleiclasticum]NYZ14683.1 DUF2889 domain-containing protein [Azospirillum oleiclasticum]NYZ22331.1 DUF2889 domain-containing protein [Azospirillum oleiclasticum]
MPLSPSADREPIHTRRITCRGYRRADGLWDVEGQLTDVKTYDFQTEECGLREPGDPIHEMWVRLTLDDDFIVRGVEAVTDKSPYLSCGVVTSKFQSLVGLTIRSGWTRAVKERLGGPQACTHLVELLGPIATTAFQTIYPVLAREQADRARQDRAAGRTAPPRRGRPALLNMCHIFASDGPVTRDLWPEHYTGPVDAPAAEAAE